MQNKDLTKIIEKALKEIHFKKEWYSDDRATEHEIKFWLKHLYMQGRIDQLELEIKSRK